RRRLVTRVVRQLPPPDHEVAHPGNVVAGCPSLQPCPALAPERDGSTATSTDTGGVPTLTYPQRFADHRQRLLDWGRGLPPLAIDAVLAIGCCLTVVVMAIADEKIRWWVFVLAGANVLPLLWRRRFPFTVTLICGVFTAWLSL